MSEITLNTAQLECLASPACADVFAALRSLGQASAAGIADRIGRSPATVYYHLKRLVSCGLAHLEHMQPTSRKPEAVYAPVAGQLRLPEGQPGSRETELSNKAVAAGLRHTLRGFERAAQREVPGPGRFHVIRTIVRLKPAEAKRFLEMIDEASRFADEHRDAEAPALHWSSVVYPEPE